jgi:uridylate kinase
MRAPILLKLSGEALSGTTEGILDPEQVDRVCREMVTGSQEFSQPLGVVVGGGNIMRGRIWADHGALSSDPARGDQMGMLATLINAIALRDGIERVGGSAVILAPYAVPQVAETFHYDAAHQAFAAGSIVIFGGGTGNPFLTTDTAAAMRGAQIRATAVLKGSNVDGIYDQDPRNNPAAKRYDQLSFADALAQGLGIMDAAAFALCQERQINVRVFDMNEPGTIQAACGPQPPGTIVHV